jgi:hypothetical protein
MRVPSWAKRVLAIIFAITLSLALLEFAIRTYSQLFFTRITNPDQALGWKHPVNARRTHVNELGETSIVTYSAHGLRGRHYDYARHSSKYRILVLGDSFVDGFSVSDYELFTALLEESDRRLEVLNAGVGGYGTVQELLYLVSEGLKYGPDLVLLMFYDNDLLDNCLSYGPGGGPRPFALLRDGNVVIREVNYEEFLKFTIPFPFRRTLHRHSYLYNFLNSKVYHRLFAPRMRDLVQRDETKAKTCGQYEILHGLLRGMFQLLKARGIDFAVALIPVREDVVKGYSDTHPPILRFCSATGIPCLPLLPRLHREHASGVGVYFPSRDIHWTRAGHRVAADEIGLFLRSMTHQR